MTICPIGKFPETKTQKFTVSAFHDLTLFGIHLELQFVLDKAGQKQTKSLQKIDELNTLVTLRCYHKQAFFHPKFQLNTFHIAGESCFTFINIRD